MGLAELINSLKDNSFRHEDIQNTEIFIKLHEDQTFFQHLASHPMYFGLMSSALSQFANLLKNSNKREIDELIFLRNLDFMCQTFINKQVKLDEIYNMYWSPETYFSFISQLNPEFKTRTIDYLQTKIKFHALRMCAQEHVNEYHDEVRSIHTRPFSYASTKFHSIDPINGFSSFYRTIVDLITEDTYSLLGKIYNAPFPHHDFFIETVSKISNYDWEQGYAGFNQNTLHGLALLYIFTYRFASETLQTQIAREFEALLKVCPDNLKKQLAEDILPLYAPFNKNPETFSACLLSRLSFERNVDLFSQMCTRFLEPSKLGEILSQEKNNLESTDVCIDLTTIHPLHEDLEKEALIRAQYCAFGNFPFIGRVIIQYKSGWFPDDQLKQLLASSPKVVLRSVPTRAERHELETTSLALLCAFSPYPVRARLEPIALNLRRSTALTRANFIDRKTGPEQLEEQKLEPSTQSGADHVLGCS